MWRIGFVEQFKRRFEWRFERNRINWKRFDKRRTVDDIQQRRWWWSNNGYVRA